MGISKDQPPKAIGYLCCPNKAWCSMAAAGKAWIWDFGPETKSDLAKCKECDFLFMTIRTKPIARTGRANNRGKPGNRGGSGRSTSTEGVQPRHVQPTPKRKATTPNKQPPTVEAILQKLQDLTSEGMSFEEAANQIKNPPAESTNVMVEPSADELKKLESLIDSFQKKIVSGIKYTDSLNTKLAEGYKKLGELKAQQDAAKASYEQMCEELALKSQQPNTAAAAATGLEVIEWPADFAHLPREAKQRVIDSQLERINKLQIFLDTNDDVNPLLNMDTEDTAEVAEDNGSLDELPDLPDADPVPEQAAQYDRASSVTGPNRVAPYAGTPSTPCPEDEEIARTLIQQLALGSEMWGPDGSHRPAAPEGPSPAAQSSTERQLG